ncbi:MAG TPA: hypothetical protein RMH99_05955 [Sandaracinaceae bacterium LLY-WYZ-13_1]|nr:hypothetical protein [Sandaracinaceae bacterium LLY-WYZ-13_1]
MRRTTTTRAARASETRRRPGLRRLRWIAIGAGLLAAGTGAAWLAWGGLLQTRARADANALDASGATDEALARAAVDGDPRERTRAVEALRARGPAGHAALMRVHAGAVEALRRAPDRDDPRVARLRRALDRVSGQRDGHASGLYWHTDLDAARREAARTGKPILSLRLLGRLDEELSCANSRYFRVVLYSNPRVAARLRDAFVLHWSSERPAPRITIDMGDGRRIVRTITGNSVHYVLDAAGRPVDTLVGLYSPVGFTRALDEALEARDACPGANAECLARVHAEQLGAQRQRWARRRERDPALPTWGEAIRSLPGAPSDEAPSARAAMPLTVGKARIETPALGLLDRLPVPTRTPAVDWHRVGVLADGAEPLPARTRALLRLKTGRDDVDATARRLAEVALADGARNEVLFRRRIHRWFARQRPHTRDRASLNRRVYAELLLTPADDPWLGLRADDLYDGVELPGD